MANPVLIGGFDTNDINTEAVPASLQSDGYSALQVVESKHYNEMFKQLFAAANKNRNDGVWEWEDPSLNDTEYNIGSITRYLGINYESLVDLNTSTPINDGINWNQIILSNNPVLVNPTINGFNFSIIDRPTKTATNSILVDGLTLTITSPVAGTDYYFSKSDITTTKNADTIGGFHYGLIPSDEAATGNKTEADMVAIRGINAYSIWTKWFRPVAEPEGMVFIGNKWYDIYLLNSEHITNGTSKAGATIAAGTTEYGRAIPKIPLEYGGNGTINYGKFTWFQACEVAKSHGKELISYAEFPTIAYGVTEEKSSQTDGYETVVGKVEHYPHLTSKYGIEQATGVQWLWGSDLANGYGTTTFSYQAVTDGRGSVYSTSNSPTAVILGGSRGDGANSGSRASNWNNYVWNSRWQFGSRFACSHLELV